MYLHKQIQIHVITQADHIAVCGNIYIYTHIYLYHLSSRQVINHVCHHASVVVIKVRARLTAIVVARGPLSREPFTQRFGTHHTGICSLGERGQANWIGTIRTQGPTALLGGELLLLCWAQASDSFLDTPSADSGCLGTPVRGTKQQPTHNYSQTYCAWKPAYTYP